MRVSRRPDMHGQSGVRELDAALEATTAAADAVTGGDDAWSWFEDPILHAIETTDLVLEPPDEHVTKAPAKFHVSLAELIGKVVEEICKHA